MRIKPINNIASIGEKSILFIPNKFCCNLLKGSNTGKLKDCSTKDSVLSLNFGIYDNITSASIVISNNLLNNCTNISIIFITNAPYLFQLNKAFELSSFFSSFVTSTLDGDNKYTLCSISCNCAPSTKHDPLIKSTNL